MVMPGLRQGRLQKLMPSQRALCEDGMLAQSFFIRMDWWGLEELRFHEQLPNIVELGCPADMKQLLIAHTKLIGGGGGIYGHPLSMAALPGHVRFEPFK